MNWVGDFPRFFPLSLLKGLNHIAFRQSPGLGAIYNIYEFIDVTVLSQVQVLSVKARRSYFVCHSFFRIRLLSPLGSEQIRYLNGIDLVKSHYGQIWMCYSWI